jgi:hypothetical protein
MAMICCCDFSVANLAAASSMSAGNAGTDQEIDIDAFAECVSADLGPDPVLISGPHLAVWARKL